MHRTKRDVKEKKEANELRETKAKIFEEEKEASYNNLFRFSKVSFKFKKLIERLCGRNTYFKKKAKIKEKKSRDKKKKQIIKNEIME